MKSQVFEIFIFYWTWAYDALTRIRAYIRKTMFLKIRILINNPISETLFRENPRCLKYLFIIQPGHFTQQRAFCAGHQLFITIKHNILL